MLRFILALLLKIIRKVDKKTGTRFTQVEHNLMLSLIRGGQHLRELWGTMALYGVPFQIDLTRLSMAELDFLVHRIHEKDCYGLRDLTVEDPVVMDVGAHLGVFSRFVLGEKPKALVYALEPDMRNFQLLKSNLAAFERAIPCQYAVMDVNTELDFFVSDAIDWHSSLGVNAEFFNKHGLSQEKFSTAYKVVCVTIDHFVEMHHLSRLDMLKITAPGEIELRVLAGARKTIERFRPHIALAIYPDNQEAVRAFFDEIGGYVRYDNPWKSKTTPFIYKSTSLMNE